jgi:plasmid stabilization system protein ParE
VVERLTAAPDVLLRQPKIGTPLGDFSPRDVRYLIVGDYEMRYELVGDTAWIVRLWHTREDR